MTEHHYSKASLAGAYARACVGALLTGGPLPLVPVESVVGAILAALCALFAFYGLHTFLRQRTRIVIDDEAIRTDGPLGRTLAWRDLSNVRLKYYSTRRDGRNGWHELDLVGHGRTIKVESSLEGFRDVLARTVKEAERRGVVLSPTTYGNLKPFGLARELRARSGAVG